MKRTNLVLDDALLKEATHVLGSRTYSEAVNIALSQAIKLAKMRGALELVGTGAWEGDLEEMRAPRHRVRASRTTRS